MSNRLIRINELIQRELSSYLRKRYQTEAAAITITGVDIAQDLKTGKVFVSVLGDDAAAQRGLAWIQQHAGELRREVGRHVVIKWTPALEYVLDTSTIRGNRILQLLDELSVREKNDHASGPDQGTGAGAPPADAGGAGAPPR